MCVCLVMARDLFGYRHVKLRWPRSLCAFSMRLFNTVSLNLVRLMEALMISLELVNSFNEIVGNYELIYGGIFMIISVRLKCILFLLAKSSIYLTPLHELDRFTWHLLFLRQCYKKKVIESESIWAVIFLNFPLAEWLHAFGSNICNK